MTKVQRCLALILVACHLCGCKGRLRGKQAAHSEPPKNMFDMSLIDHPTGVFAPMECNKYIDSDPCATTFSSYFKSNKKEKRFQFQQTVTVPCGTCIMMDQHEGTLEFANGLEVQGKLIVPDGIRLQMKTTYILVQGEFHLESSKPINGVPNIRIGWADQPFRTNVKPISFRQSNNTDACGGDYHECNLGKKPFVVAGGRVSFRGLPSTDMPTWVPIHHVESTGWTIPATEIAQYQPPPINCPHDGILIDSDFSSQGSGTFRTTYGSSQIWTDHSLRAVDRTRKEHGVVVDLKNQNQCMEAGQKYIITAQVILSKAAVSGRTDCGGEGGEDHCLYIASKYEDVSGNAAKTIRWIESESHKVEYGKPLFIAIETTFDEKELASENAHHVMVFGGPDIGVDIEILDFTLMLLPPEAFRDPENACDNLVPPNGHAELFPVSPYPFYASNDRTHVIVKEEGQNRYFQITGRDSLSKHGWNDGSITWDVPTSCIKPHSMYKIHVDVRVHGNKPIVLEWFIRGHYRARDHAYEVLVTCPPSHGEWVSCEGEFTASVALTFHAVRYDIVAATKRNSHVNYDVDNLSFELIEGAIDRLIVPDSIEGKWVSGAQLLLTSHTPQWDYHQIAKIKSVETYKKEPGYVRVQLGGAVDRPITFKENGHYATEVALLSRNIEFDGRGAYFSILHTPNVEQVIQGVDFSTFGQAGFRDRYPIHFDFCQNSTGSVISKNTIRLSNQRCVVLHATDNVLVEGNVAYDTRGHCFVLEGGMETGNVFRNNLGAVTKSATTLMPQVGVSGKETDVTPATFWMSNPSNQWYGNVAAGSDGYGYWLQVRDKTRGPHSTKEDEEKDGDASSPIIPNQMRLQSFSNNIAHAIRYHSLKINEYRPIQTENISNFTSYMTGEGHFDVSSSSNLTLANIILDKELDDNVSSRRIGSVYIVERLGLNATSTRSSSGQSSGITGQTGEGASAPNAPSVFFLRDAHSS